MESCGTPTSLMWVENGWYYHLHCAFDHGNDAYNIQAQQRAPISKLTVWGILFFFILSFGLYALYQNEASSGGQLLRSGNVVPEVISTDLALPEQSATDLATENIPLPEAGIAPVEAPTTSSNSTE